MNDNFLDESRSLYAQYASKIVENKYNLANCAIVDVGLFARPYDLLIGDSNLYMEVFLELCLLSEIIVFYDKLICVDKNGVIEELNKYFRTPVELFKIFDNEDILFYRGDIEEMAVISREEVDPAVAQDLKEDLEIRQIEEKGSMPIFEYADFESINWEKIAGDIGISFYNKPIPISNRIQQLNQLSPSVEFYKRLASIHNVAVERLLCYKGIKQVYIPPIMSIVLDMSKKREDIPKEIIEVRKRFEPTRKKLTNLEESLYKETKLGRQLDIMDEMDNCWYALLSKMKKKDTRILYKWWNIVKEGTPLNMIIKYLDEKYSIDERDRTVANIEGIFDLWKASRQVNKYERLLKKVFKEDLVEDSKMRVCAYLKTWGDRGF
jgi:hypothetical protein